MAGNEKPANLRLASLGESEVSALELSQKIAEFKDKISSASDEELRARNFFEVAREREQNIEIRALNVALFGAHCCAACAYYHPRQQGFGECRYGARRHSDWPATGPHEWCGRYRKIRGVN